MGSSVINKSIEIGLEIKRVREIKT